MNHEIFSGTHYNIGRQWGQKLAQRNVSLLSQIPFPLSEETGNFASACLPVYQKFFPEILDEIQGVADGQGCSPEKLRTLLFSLYSIAPGANCSCFALSGKGQILLGRNSDFFSELKEQNMNVIYDVPAASQGFTANTTSFIQMEDGVNRLGLAVGLTSVLPRRIKPGMNAGLLLRFFLEKCRNVDDVLQSIAKIPISSSQTFTAADPSGRIALIECSSEHVSVSSTPLPQNFLCAVNSFHMSPMDSLQKAAGEEWFSERRYRTMRDSLIKGRVTDASSAQKLLSGEHGFLSHTTSL
ncbi:C45 family autoproteolytic acyltransferase/hydolase [Pyramidobacter sp. CG50-2]|uniref:C45 family autoproteolytic acyltransferase/hydolase n=1 Tax=Pyramidobacter sp. CG50-2 TaxID=2382160 RepID=UPI000EA1E7FD|nr:C45 family peptidase [Pyramidobacter sp. CG50-2]RKJ76615.1 acyl-CoA--6-aminopenicillanic acid acyltransferase [Pyramidobacter sp. CG50-2]